MSRKFDYFIVFAEMRTGSNFLETNLNAFADIACLGEAFNPHFIGFPDAIDCLGVTQAQRDGDPDRLLEAIRKTPDKISGFRYFHDHDPRIFDTCMNDPRCAKIILTRNPVDSYVSWKIAQETGQWKLTNMKSRKDAKADFDPVEFEAHAGALQEFQVRLSNRLQTTGQTAFYVAYEDLQSIAVMNGLAAFLGSDARLEELDKTLKPQNPAPVAEKVKDFEAVERGLARLDRFNLTRTPNFEPRRGAMVPAYVAAPSSGLLCLPVRGGPEAECEAWLAAVDGMGIDALTRDFTQKSLRQWRRQHPGARTFAVVRHPLARAHHVFCTRILDPGGFVAVRTRLQRMHGLSLPDALPSAAYDRTEHRRNFALWLEFCRGNLSGQTAIRQDPAWATQVSLLQGMTEMALPDMIVREEEMALWLPAMANIAGCIDAPEPAPAPADAPFTLAEIYDPELESLCRDAYQRDYMFFGFADWSPAQAA